MSKRKAGPPIAGYGEKRRSVRLAAYANIDITGNRHPWVQLSPPSKPNGDWGMHFVDGCMFMDRAALEQLRDAISEALAEHPGEANASPLQQDAIAPDCSEKEK